MNPHITSIALETLSHLRHNAMSAADMESLQVPDAFIEKFAEHLVKRCATVASTLPHTQEHDWLQNSVTCIPTHCAQNILRHFGVQQ
jgi:hypothetical protein